MGIGASLFLLAIGAVLTFALGESTVGSLNLDTVGIILMIVGAVGILLSMMFWSSWGGPGGRRESHTTVVRDRDRDVV